MHYNRGVPDETFRPATTLKRDHFGRIERGIFVDADGREHEAVRRDTRGCPLWTRAFARLLLAKEARVLDALAGAPWVPQPLSRHRDHLVRGWIDGQAMQDAGRADATRLSITYFREARRLLVAMHRRCITHNDLAKEPNWLVDAEGHPALIDFQLARVSPRRSWAFRMMAREDLRHLLKHKRTYQPAVLTARERALLAAPSGPARFHRQVVKPVYTLITRRLMNWQDREGRGR